MSETKVVEAKVEPVVEVVEPQEPSVPELSPVEQQAVDQGWMPLEDWKSTGGDEGEWRTAKEYVERGELYKSIHSTKRELKQTQAALSAMQRHNKYVFDQAYQTAMRDLKLQKRSAMREGDFEQLEAVENEIEQLQEKRMVETQSLQQVDAVAVAQTPPPEFTDFTNRNPWYVTNKDLRDEADAVGFVYLNNGGSSIGLFQHVEREMKRKFPEKFGVKRGAPSAVASVNRTARGKAGVEIELDALETKIMNDLVEAGEMTQAEYKSQLRKAKGLK